ncbi:hypothetical protein EG68_01147 [Paragonimus skrjabini miyazakii]|uniref:Uncharacterized protein n=1 Tax=Paragonimus skrjabini miyazakii TaxID=59628 RepID=A0A8S9Z956_9TREM|nr:hypothetical protein EG68_01147 [Paragonimus skrjabini miyazakii]
MKRFYCLPGLSKSTLNRRLRRLAAEQDDPAALSDIATDELPVAASADRGMTVVDAPVVGCESRLTMEDVGNDEGLPTVEIQGSPSTSVGQLAGQIADTMSGSRVRYSSVDNFTGSISEDILATYMHCNMSLTDLALESHGVAFISVVSGACILEARVA